MAKTIEWTPVDEALAEGRESGFKLAVLEAGKIFEQRLREERIAGGTVEEKVETIRYHLTKPDDVTKAMKYFTTLRIGTTGPLQQPKAQRLVQAFRQGVADLNAFGEARSKPLAQAKLAIGYLKGKQRWLLRGLIGLGAFFLLVVLLADTGAGRSVVDGIVHVVNTFFSWIITLLILFGVLIAVVLGTAVYLDRTKAGTVRGEDEHGASAEEDAADTHGHH